MERRLTAICVTLAIMFSCMVASVSADEFDNGTWVELLETGFVNGGSHNNFDYTTSKTISINTPTDMRICKIDMLFTYSVGTLPTKVEFYNLNGWTSLTVKEIGPGLARAYGTVRSTFYSNVQLRFTRTATTTTYCELLSCKVSRITTQDFVADSDVYVEGMGTHAIGEKIQEVDGDTQTPEKLQLRVNVYDWQKFDTLTIWGTMEAASINSIRVTVGTKGLPFDVSYMDMENNGEWMHAVSHHYETNDSTSTDASITNWYGKTLYCITIDLAGVDRTKTDPLYVYFTGNYNGYIGWTFNCQTVNGSIIVPDTSEATWWTRFTSFMTGLLSPNSGTVDDFESEAEEQGNQLGEMNDELQNVTRPAIDDIETDIGDYVNSADFAIVAEEFSSISHNGLITQITMLSLTVALVAYILYGKR